MDRNQVIAIDWGTSNRRCYLLAADGRVLDRCDSDRGVLRFAPADFPDEIERIRARFGGAPVLASGMIGSTRGWIDAGYADAPATIADLARGARSPADNVFVTPGVANRAGDRADVMRGEEVQILGAVAAGLAPGTARLCQPGTHNKWIAISDGRIVDFATAMPGELFELLRTGGILAGMLDSPVMPGAAFERGVRRGLSRCDLTTALFEVRAQVLLGRLPADDAAAAVSGILIGNDIGAQGDLAGATIHLISTGVLADLYAFAIDVAGGAVVRIDSHAAFVAGAHAIWEQLP